MAQVKISALTPADPLTGAEELPLVQGGVTKRTPVSGLDSLRQWFQLLEPTISAGALAIDLDSPAGFHVVLTEDVTSLTFPNASASRFIEFTVAFEQDATGGRSITFPASVQNPPTIAPSAGAVTITRFATWDGGTTIHTLSTV